MSTKLLFCVSFIIAIIVLFFIYLIFSFKKKEHMSCYYKSYMSELDRIYDQSGLEIDVTPPSYATGYFYLRYKPLPFLFDKNI